jgi:asparagine synthase (glutamine-hydrolysing)
VDYDLIKSMIRPIIHRGPDDEGIWIDDNLGFGFRRLSIIDLSPLGHQPMINETGTITIVFNGEIYNFQELRKDCEEKGFRFKSRTDTEVIIALYQIYGERFPEFLRGMFAIALWDKNNQKLLLVRDRIGKKPLHYYFDGQQLMFGSEIKSIVAVKSIQKEIDWDSIDEYFAYGFISAPKTIYKNIHKVLPGNMLKYENGKISEKPFWELRPSTIEGADEKEMLEAIRAKISESVKIRMISDVPLGAFLSGGIDSSLVVAFMAQHSSTPVKTFSIGFGEKDFDETKYAREIANIFSTDHTEEVVTPNYADIIESIINDFDEPFGDSSALPTYIVSKLTRKYVTVALSGDGGDELFGGYDHYSIALKERIYDSVPGFIKPVFKGFSNIFPDKLRGGNALFRMSVKTPQQRFIERRKVMYDTERNKIYSDLVLNKIGNYNVNKEQLKFFKTATNVEFLVQCQFNDFKYIMVDDILVKVDRMSMLNSLETRCPLLDHELAELAFQLPASFMIRNGAKKYMLKKILGGLIPAYILNRPKQGFALPLKYWFNKELYDFAMENIFSDAMINSGMFNMNNIQLIYNIHKSGRRDMSFQLWHILAFAIWLQKNYN